MPAYDDRPKSKPDTTKEQNAFDRCAACWANLLEEAHREDCRMRKEDLGIQS